MPLVLALIPLPLSDWLEWGSRDALRSRIRRKAVPNARAILAIIHHHIHLLLHLRLPDVVLHRTRIDLAAPRARGVENGGSLSQVSHSGRLCIRLPAVHVEVSADADSGDASGCVLSGSTLRPCRVDIRYSPCLGPWVCGHVALCFHITVDILYNVGNLRELLQKVQTHLGRVFCRSLSPYNSLHEVGYSLGCDGVVSTR